jgi:peptidoglycan/LPS O-acetylase OafA/YrhL
VRAGARTVYVILTWLFVIGLLVQVFLAGRGVFDNPTLFATHRDFGFLLEIVPLLLLVIGLVAGVGRRLAAFALVAFLLFILQSVFVAARDSSPMIAALHPVNGFLILVLAIEMAREAWLGRTTTA